MTADQELLQESAEDLFENAPCGYLTTDLDGTILKVNRTFESLLGLRREALIGTRRFQDLLSPGGRIYYETHYAPLVHMQGAIREIALELVADDGSLLPALVSSVVRNDDAGRPRLIRTTVFEASDRRRYEEELLEARRREREIADELQRSLLSGALPTSEGIEIAVAYRPGVSGIEVGGDWYDAFWLAEGRNVGLVVGDVVGRGISAAATMGQLRSAVRALAATGLGPGGLIEALDAYVRRHGVGRMTSLVYAELHLETGELRFACAGHPPPLIVPPDSESRFAWEGRSMPLDAFDEDLRADAVERIEPGGLVVLYTDGLVERPSRPLGDGMELLLAEVEAHRHEPVDIIATAVMRALAHGERPDDACLLGARLVAV